MSRYIDADKIEYEDMLRPRGNGDYEECQIAYRDQIDDITTADVRENVRGEWQVTENIENDCYVVRCSNCHASVRVGGRILYDAKIELNNYCPNCGADMRREDNGRDEENHNRV